MRAIADEIVALGWSSSDIRFVGSKRGKERQLLAGAAGRLTTLPGRGIRRSLAWRSVVANVGAVLSLLAAMVEAFILALAWRPVAIVSVGGYASFPFSFAGVVLRRPLILVDFDAVAGAAHRVVGRFAVARCVAFSSDDPRSVDTGAPVRSSLELIDRGASARRKAKAAFVPPIDVDRRVVVVMTGSLGAKSVNEAVAQLATMWNDRADLCIVHVTGQRDFEAISAVAPAAGALDYRLLAFGDMEKLWALADVALCRAGAITIAELQLLGIASVLVPLPHSPGDHQAKNARELEQRGAAIVVGDAHCSAPTLGEALDQLLEPSTLARASRAAREGGRPGAARSIARVVLEVARG